MIWICKIICASIIESYRNSYGNENDIWRENDIWNQIQFCPEKELNYRNQAWKCFHFVELIRIISLLWTEKRRVSTWGIRISWKTIQFPSIHANLFRYESIANISFFFIWTCHFSRRYSLFLDSLIESN